MLKELKSIINADEFMTELLAVGVAIELFFGVLGPAYALSALPDPVPVEATEIVAEETVDISPVKAKEKLVNTAGSPRVLSDEEVVGLDIGNDIIPLEDCDLVRFDLPSKYYPSMNFSTMQPYMSYKTITNKSSEAYKVCNSEKAYTDANGYRRSKVSVNEFSINGEDDYVIALGTYYKPRGTCGDRWLIVTSNGMYTAITGDEKADKDTDRHHMVHPHGNGKYSLVEFIVDSKQLEPISKKMGPVYYSEVGNIGGEILYVYSIQ